MKARSIVATHPNELGNVVVTLGGFHVALSFLIAIGKLMQGSGLKEALSQIYGPNSIKTILNGHAYSHAVWGHSLVHLVLMEKILNEFEYEPDELGEVRNILKTFSADAPPTIH